MMKCINNLKHLLNSILLCKSVQGIVFPLLLILSLVVFVWAAPYQNEMFSFRQPDGSLVPVVVSGDEFYQDVETLDGYSLIRDPITQWICYAKLSNDRVNLLSTGIRYTAAKHLPKSHMNASLEKHLRINKESVVKQRNKKYHELFNSDTGNGNIYTVKSVLNKKTARETDTIYGVTILIDFPDQKSLISKESIESFVNQTGYKENRNNGSVKDYFYDISAGKLVYLQKVTDFITAKYEKSYYDRTDGSGYAGSNELVKEVLTTIKTKRLFDFSCATQRKRRVLAVNILYAGSPTAGWAQGLWPHSGQTKFYINGVYVRNHMMASIGTKLTIGTFCHENGHMLCGWPDLYSYEGHSSGVGRFCLMGVSGSTNPVPPNAYLRSLMGWMEITEISNDGLGNVYKLSVNSNQACFYTGISTTGSNELYCIEARRKQGRNTYLPDEGLLIWHIDKSGDNTTSEKNDFIMPEQADGKNDLENDVNNGDSKDLFSAPLNKNFSDKTIPSAMWHNGSESEIQLANVSAINDTMTFSFGQKITNEGNAVDKSEQEKLVLYISGAILQYSIPENNNIRSKVRIKVCDLNGNVLSIEEEIKLLTETTYTVNFSDFTKENRRLAPGIYVCTIQYGNLNRSVPFYIFE